MSETEEARVAVLEQIARDTAAALVDIRTELREFRQETRSEFRSIRAEHREDFRLLLSRQDRHFYWLLAAIAAVLGVMAHGFHWI